MKRETTKRKKNHDFLSFIVSLVMFFTILLFGVSAYSETGVTGTEIKVGMTGDVSGPIAFYGKNIKIAAEAYFARVNERGGIHSRKLILFHEDDRYDAAMAVAGLKKLMDKDQVFCFIGNMGQAPVLAQAPILEEREIALMGPVTSASILGIKPKKYVFPIVPNYSAQGRGMVNLVMEELKIRDPKIAAIYHADFGDDPLSGVKEQLEKYDKKVVIAIPHPRGAIDLSSEVAKANRAGANILLLLTTYKEGALMLKEAEKMNWKPTFIVAASANDPKLVELAGQACEGAYVQSSFASTDDVDVGGVKDYTALLEKYSPGNKPTTFGLYGGYAASRVLEEGLKRAGRDLTMQKLIQSLETFRDFDMLGVVPPLTYKTGSREGSRATVFYKIEGGKFNRIMNWTPPKK